MKEVIKKIVEAKKSQSPYGAKWFATLVPGIFWGISVPTKSQSPYGAKWFATVTGADWLPVEFCESQSPYGAKWFATLTASSSSESCWQWGRNPLTGLSGLQQWVAESLKERYKDIVAIPLRG